MIFLLEGILGSSVDSLQLFVTKKPPASHEAGGKVALVNFADRQFLSSAHLTVRQLRHRQPRFRKMLFERCIRCSEVLRENTWAKPAGACRSPELLYLKNQE
jgi:hypothetical protein